MLALLCVNLLTFVNEVEIAAKGLGKIHPETVKGLVEYARAHNKAQIRSSFDSADKENQLSNRIIFI